MARGSTSREKAKQRKLSGLKFVDGLELRSDCTIDEYVSAASEYVRQSGSLTDSQKKTGQIRLSEGLGKALLGELLKRIPGLTARVGEFNVAGALRIAKADLSEFHQLDGLRLAVEIKPVNLAVGRAIWNRFGDIRTFAVNLHLKFPFAVIGGVLSVPTYEIKGAEKKSTRHLIQRAIARLVRAGGRRTEGDAPHLLEGIGVVVYDPDSGRLDDNLPSTESELRWTDFVDKLAFAYHARFEGSLDQVAASETDDEQGSSG